MIRPRPSSSQGSTRVQARGTSERTPALPEHPFSALDLCDAKRRSNPDSLSSAPHENPMRSRSTTWNPASRRPEDMASLRVSRALLWLCRSGQVDVDASSNMARVHWPLLRRHPRLIRETLAGCCCTAGQASAAPAWWPPCSCSNTGSMPRGPSPACVQCAPERSSPSPKCSTSLTRRSPAHETPCQTGGPA